MENPESNHSSLDHYNAIRDFRAARQKADLIEFLARLTGSSVNLLSFEHVRRSLKAQVSASKALQEIPIEAIIGSVNRYEDFTRDFLPRARVDEERWAKVEMATYSSEGMPPIEVYQIGEAYFVIDGNHRVSVARQVGATYIQAYVTEVQSQVSLTPDIQPDDLILKGEYADFLEMTRFNIIRPQADLSVSVPGQYLHMIEHISVHRYFMGIDYQREISEDEAIAHWYDEVYSPLVEIIRDRGMLRDFPDRTEADLYLWLSDHRAELAEEIGFLTLPQQAAEDFVEKFSPRPGRIATRIRRHIYDALVPDALESSSRYEKMSHFRDYHRRDDRLFNEILVPFNGKTDGWFAVRQAIEVAKREESRLDGLYIVKSEKAKESPTSQKIGEEFSSLLLANQISGNFVIGIGNITRTICEQARWRDLVVVNLSHPPESKPLARLSSGFRNLILRSPRPILAVPQTFCSFQCALLAYDGSPRANDVLFIATYIAGQWKIPLYVLTVMEERLRPELQDYARKYLFEHNVQAEFLQESGDVATAIINNAAELGADLILMGGYGHSPVIQAVLGSAVDQVLRTSRVPIMIC